MTDHFEVHERDGAARLGELRLADPVTTPALADPFLEDAGSLWAAEQEVPDGDDDALTVLPHRAFPAGTRDPVKESFRVDGPDVDYPSAVVVAADDARDVGADAYLLSDAEGFVGHAAAFVEAIVEVRETLPTDTAVFLSGVATPRNAATLVYAGVDLLDATKARARGLEGMYLTDEGEYFLEDLEELPCACPACATPREEFDRADCAAHNVNALKAELRRIRHRIREGRLRDYVEGQARHDQWLTATMRRLDDQWAYLEERTPLIRDSELTAATEDTLSRVEIQRFADRVTSRYRSRLTDHPLVLVPCSATKPYSDSQSHRQFHDAIQWRGHVASMTSPIGVVPQELETTYPAQHYDSVVTGDWSGDEIEFVAEVLRRYLERNDYPRVIAHVPEDGYREICERVAAEVDTPFEYTCVDHPTTDESLGELNAALQGEDAYRKREREHATVRALADYQLGDGAGDALFPEDLRTTGRYPKIQSWTDGVGDDGTQLATMVPQYGVHSFTLAGGKRWVESDAPTKRVEIDGFVPRGSVLAPGVLDASDDIRPGDEVVIEGPKAFAVGRAAMSGPEMVDSSRGIAVEIRHSEEK
ncbi:archaeosine synthase subunit alpha [Haloparvum sedimenti]|uniref:archaeosine synthase subunit alpha n=1 Tax=Haloparvum sedimenti TaxID=1678448 RepID=UPI00071E7865|nr:archaeosine synthase subunit alpha [Haloparvum sedimenti]